MRNGAFTALAALACFFPVSLLFTCVILCFNPLAQAQRTDEDYGPHIGSINKLGTELDIRSGARIIAENALSGNILLPGIGSPVPGGYTVPAVQLRGGNVQVNDPASDYVQIFSGFRPFVHALQSEVSIAAFGPNIVATYNDLAGVSMVQKPDGFYIDRLRIAGFSTSNDGGKTWRAGSFPPMAGAFGTYGDPSVGVDRWGNFYFANLGVDPGFNTTVQVNKSADGGNTWSSAVAAAIDDGADKDWLAVGPDPVNKNRDNVYITWTSFQPTACELRFARSIDGGETYTAQTIFVPSADPDPTHPQNCLQSSNIVVDQDTGTIYIPFLRYSNANQDFIQMLASADAGETFAFVSFNVAGAPDPTLLPITPPGEFTSCGGRDVELTIHDTYSAGPGRYHFPRYVNATRVITQPAVAARNGMVYLAWSNSSSQILGDRTAGSNVMFILSEDRGNTWSAPVQVNPSTDLHHVMPALAIDQDPNDVHITYYTQHESRMIDLDMANSHDRGHTFPTDRVARVSSTSFALSPSNIPLTGAPYYYSTNFDAVWPSCYSLGEYQSVTTSNGAVFAGWGDTRNLITEPINSLDPISGQTHSQPDVFFQKVKAQ
jgi:hypothetical protein